MKKVRICEISAVIIITLLVPLAFSKSVASALVTENIQISSTGSINYPAWSTNLAVIPADWRIGETWNAPTYLDYNVLHDGHPSIRMEKGTDASKSREILDADKTQDDWSIRVKPGDHIIFRVWMKTNASTIGDTTPGSGIRLGIDFYSGPANRINGIQSPDGSYWTPGRGFPSNQYLNYVNWGNDWTQRTMEFTIPDQYPSDGFGGYPAGQLVTPDRMIPWIQVWSGTYENADDGVAWFADAELSIYG